MRLANCMSLTVIEHIMDLTLGDILYFLVWECVVFSAFCAEYFVLSGCQAVFVRICKNVLLPVDANDVAEIHIQRRIGNGSYF